MMFAWVTLAVAGVVEIGVHDLPLRPGRAVTVTVASTGPSVPALQVTGGAARRDAAEPSVHRWTVVPEAGVLQLTAAGVDRSFEVVPPTSGQLDVPERVEGTVDADEVSVWVRGDEVSVDALQVVVSEGRLVDAIPEADGVRLVVALEHSPFPRVVLVGVRDVRTADGPVWVPIRLRARPRLPLVAEAGASLTVAVGERSYGPFAADEQGRIEAVIDQYPGEAVARAVLTDDLGNTTRTDMPLPMLREQRLLGMVAGSLVPDLAAPTLFLGGFRDDGSALPPGAPSCRTPDADLVVVGVGKGSWAASLPPPADGVPADLRVVCAFAGVERTERITVPEGVPFALKLRTFPAEVRADFPEAEVRVVLEDVRGDRLPPDRVDVQAEAGLVELEPIRGHVLRGAYDGHEAVEPGSDVLVARLPHQLGEGAVRAVRGGWQREEGRLRAFGRALDSLGRPLRNASVQLELDGSLLVNARTDDEGFVTADAPATNGPLHRLTVGSGPWRHEVVVTTEALGGTRPGVAALETRAVLPVRAGALSGIRMEVEPPLLRAAPGAVAWVYVTLEDRNGLPLKDATLRLEADEGTIGEPRQRGDGAWVAEYQPEPGGQLREVVVTAVSEGVRSSTTLSVQPRLVRMSIGPWLGGVTNFGEVGTWAVGADLDIRLRSQVVGEAVMVRLGASGYGLASDVPDSDLALRGSVVPVHGALLLRQDAGAWGLWAGAGGAIALHRLELRSGQDVISEGYRGLGGPIVLGGVGRRAFGGEALLEVRGSWLDGPVGEVGWSGNLGGLAAGVGWRVLY